MIKRSLNPAPDPPSRQPRPAHETWQPVELIERLSPSLRSAYQKLSEPITSRIEHLVRRVPVRLQIPPDRVLKYALLVAEAERELLGREVSRKHAIRARAEAMGQQHGFEFGYEQPEVARKKSARSRQARQRIEASLTGARNAWKRAEQVVRKERSQLPIHLQEIVSDAGLAAVSSALTELQYRLRLPDHASPGGGSGGEESTRSLQTYWLWTNLFPQYRGKWGEMFDLAHCWILTGAGTVEAFRQIVRKGCGRATAPSIGLPSSWIRLLSEKS